MSFGLRDLKLKRADGPQVHVEQVSTLVVGRGTLSDIFAASDGESVLLSGVPESNVDYSPLVLPSDVDPLFCDQGSYSRLNQESSFYKDGGFRSFSSRYRSQELSSFEEFFRRSRQGHINQVIQPKGQDSTVLRVSIDDEVIKVRLSGHRELHCKKLVWCSASEQLKQAMDPGQWNQALALEYEANRPCGRLFQVIKVPQGVSIAPGTYFVPLSVSKEEGHVVVDVLGDGKHLHLHSLVDARTPSEDELGKTIQHSRRIVSKAFEIDRNKWEVVHTSFEEGSLCVSDRSKDLDSLVDDAGVFVVSQNAKVICHFLLRNGFDNP